MAQTAHLAVTLATILTAAATALLVGGCGMFGGVTLGAGTQNDPVPGGTIVAQGPFMGVNGRTVAGNVAVYMQPSSPTECTYVVRLQNLSAPDDSLLYVIPVVNGSPSVTPNSYVLRSPSGNENYRFTGAACGATFAQVTLTNPTLTPQSAQNYGIANLTQVSF